MQHKAHTRYASTNKHKRYIHKVHYMYLAQWTLCMHLFVYIVYVYLIYLPAWYILCLHFVFISYLCTYCVYLVCVPCMCLTW